MKKKFLAISLLSLSATTFAQTGQRIELSKDLGVSVEKKLEFFLDSCEKKQIKFEGDKAPENEHLSKKYPNHSGELLFKIKVPKTGGDFLLTGMNLGFGAKVIESEEYSPLTLKFEDLDFNAYFQKYNQGYFEVYVEAPKGYSKEKFVKSINRFCSNNPSINVYYRGPDFDLLTGEVTPLILGSIKESDRERLKDVENQGKIGPGSMANKQ